MGGHGPRHEAATYYSNPYGARDRCGYPVSLQRHIISPVTLLLTVPPSDPPRPPVVRACVIDKRKGRRYASVSYIPDVGHMVCNHDTHDPRAPLMRTWNAGQILQVNPDAVADLVSGILEQIASGELVARL